ncbi:hypothetical protein Hdeb2414_s0015g00451961 [Helianthus debilis subsp. tardiflorus]
MTAEITLTREERHARLRLDDVYDAYKEATRAGRWSKERECYVDPQGNPTVDPKTVDLNALVAAIPTVSVWCKGLREIPRYKEKVEEKAKELVEEKTQVTEEDQIQKAEETTMPVTGVLKNTEDCEIESWSSLAHEEEAEAAGPWFG